MRWTTKAWIQSSVARLPDRLSYPLYFRLQRHFGNLRRCRIDPSSRLLHGMEFCRQIVRHGCSPVARTFFEVGTGRRLNFPIACWLCGADRVFTVDLNPYLRFSLIKEDLQYLRRHQVQVQQRLQSEYGDLLQMNRWHQLLELRPTRVEELTTVCGIEYQAPADARRTGLAIHSIDFHVSCNVFEHIPPDDLQAIMAEANRITKPTGLLLHLVDHTDHFSHADPTLSPLHFLRYSDVEWRRYADNRHAYVNRLREDDYLRYFGEIEVRAVDSQPDPAVFRLLNDKTLPLDERFRDKTPETLSRLTSLFVLASRAADPPRQVATHASPSGPVY